MSNIVFYTAVLIAAIIVLMGSVSAGIIILGKDNEFFWQRIWPATMALIASVIGAAFILWVAGAACA